MVGGVEDVVPVLDGDPLLGADGHLALVLGLAAGRPALLGVDLVGRVDAVLVVVHRVGVAGGLITSGVGYVAIGVDTSRPTIKDVAFVLRKSCLCRILGSVAPPPPN